MAEPEYRDVPDDAAENSGSQEDKRGSYNPPPTFEFDYPESTPPPPPPKDESDE